MSRFFFFLILFDLRGEGFAADSPVELFETNWLVVQGSGVPQRGRGREVGSGSGNLMDSGSSKGAPDTCMS